MIVGPPSDLVRAASPVAAAIAKQAMAVVAAVSMILGMRSLPLVRLISVEMRLANPSLQGRESARHLLRGASCCAVLRPCTAAALSLDRSFAGLIRDAPRRRTLLRVPK